MKKRIAFAATAIVLMLALSFSIGYTIAWIHTNTGSVTNIFEYGDVNIDLVETVDGTRQSAEANNVTNDKFMMVPGNVLAKDPTVIVRGAENAVDCYLFVKVLESNNLDDFLDYAIADGWKLYNTDTAGSNIDTITNDQYVLYRKVSASMNDIDFPILEDNRVSVKSEVTKVMLNGLTNTTYPTLTFTAYAVQQSNLTLEQAYNQAFPSQG